MREKTGRMSPPHPDRSDLQGNYSVAGEEDPGASLRCCPTSVGPSREDDARMLHRAIKQWENEGGSVPKSAARAQTIQVEHLVSIR